MSVLVAPVFVIEGLDDVYVYGSVEEAALSLEPWWVLENLGVAYDAEGRLLRLAVDKHNVVISPGDPTPLHASDLESSLRSYLQSIGETLGDDPEASLVDLVKFCSDLNKS